MERLSAGDSGKNPNGLIGFLRRAFTTLTVFFLVGCSVVTDTYDTFGPTIDEIHKMSPEDAAVHIAGKTVMTFGEPSSQCNSSYVNGFVIQNCHKSGPGHGTQIEYIDTDGRAYLWYPGNSHPVPSLWKLQKKGERYQICGMFPTRSYNPVRKTYGGQWECQRLGDWVVRIREIRAGDIFNLSSGQVPWKLSKDRTTFDELLKR